MFPIVMLKECSESVLWGMLQKYCACQQNADALRLPIKTTPSLILCKRARVRCLAHQMSFSQEFMLSAVNHMAGVRLLRMPSRRYKLAAVGKALSWMLLGTRCYQGGSNGYWPDRMLLGTRRYQVGSDSGSSIMDASRNPTLTPGWQRWGKLHRGCLFEVGMHGCFRHSIADAEGTGKYQLAYMNALVIRSRNAVIGDEARCYDGKLRR